MKIVILQGAFLPVPPILGGAVEKVWFKIGKEFAALGHDVIHISKKSSSLPSNEIIEGVRHVRIKGFGTPSGMFKLKMLDLLYTINSLRVIPSDADIIITNTFWAPVLIAKKTRRHIYVDVQRMPKGQLRFYSKAARLRANSSSVSAAMLEELKVDKLNQVVMIPNPLPFDIAEGIDYGAKKNVILYTGRVHPEKGLHLIIRAFREAASGWTLRIVGPWEIRAGGGGAEFLNELKEMAAGMKVEFVDPVFDIEKLNNFYREAAIFVYPSVAEKGETFGLAPLEAMAWGCVPVVSNLSCFHDFIKDGENGCVFDHRSDDAVALLTAKIVSLQTNPAERVRLGQKALNVRTTHSAKTIAGLFLEEFALQSANKK